MNTLLDIVFVILNYNVFDVTVNCVESIKKNIDTNQYHIIIVDNASPNHAGEKLHKLFKEDRYVSYVYSTSNVGFARGNNLGIDFAREHYPSKFVCCLNNDTLLKQKNFFSVLNRKYEEGKPAMIGPKIHLLNDKVQPIMPKLASVDVYVRIRNKLMHENTYWAVVREYLLSHPLIEWLNNLRHQIKGDYPSDYNNSTKSYNEEQKNVVLQGCCLIFTPVFFTKLKGFNPKTFMYVEENILFVSIRKAGMHTLYCPKLNIIHLESLSTTSVKKNSIKRRKFLCENEIRSLEVLIDEMRFSDTKQNVSV